ncbi:hypothetical protein [Streptomyces omiyaensis]|uniref:hypothetical protein n=1 Tax=Streptomyces omiyaensis TaxID=68247 RepID=UPI0036F915FF
MSTPTTDSPARIRRIYDRHAGLYADSLIAEATALLDAYLATAAQHGYGEKADEDGWLARSAAETVVQAHRQRGERSSTETYKLIGALRAAFETEGLEVVSTPVRMGIGVAPLPGGPTWGTAGGLAVALYVDSGWELMLNATRTTSHSIHAPVTEAGAAEVAQLVRGVLRGDLPDPFRRNR